MRQAQFNRFKLDGFTLVELLVVIGTIAVLIAILLPTLNRARLLLGLVLAERSSAGRAGLKPRNRL